MKLKNITIILFLMTMLLINGCGTTAKSTGSYEDYQKNYARLDVMQSLELVEIGNTISPVITNAQPSDTDTESHVLLTNKNITYLKYKLETDSLNKVTSIYGRYYIQGAGIEAEFEPKIVNGEIIIDLTNVVPSSATSMYVYISLVYENKNDMTQGLNQTYITFI